MLEYWRSSSPSQRSIREYEDKRETHRKNLSSIFWDIYSGSPLGIYSKTRLLKNGYEGSYLSNFLANTLRSTQVEINTDAKTLRPVARLKEPRDLFSLPKEPECAQEAARWPAECQVKKRKRKPIVINVKRVKGRGFSFLAPWEWRGEVIDMRVQHIDAVPPFPEAYYNPTGKEVQPKPVGEEDGTIVFQYHPMSAVNYDEHGIEDNKSVRTEFSRSTARGNRPSLVPHETRDLKFESRFESGNLAKAVKITETYYELSLRTDLYTNRHVQWFYFMVENTRKGFTYRFSIVNLSKGDSLYNSGMKPVLYSTKDAVIKKIGWKRCGFNIAYYKNDSQGQDDDQNGTYTLSFNIEFPHDDDCVYLAHSYPYTYTDLQEYLIKLQNHPVKSAYTKLRLLCKTLAGNNVYYLTVTEPPRPDEDIMKKKKAVIVTARVHPGETPASWMMKGVMDFLTGDTKQARELREKFIFKLVPMLNPDGVIVGNNRCSLTGRDLNRQYRTVIRETYPPVWHTKLMVRRLLEDCGVAMYCDFHAHSRKHNVFIYGCENKRSPEKKLHEQVFPLMLHKNTADKFSFENCKFRIQRSKEGTGRVVVWMMGVSNSYTMEASFAGSTLGTRHSTHFSTLDYESMGRSFCETLLDFVDDAPSKEKLRTKIIARLQKEGSNADEPTNISLSDYSSDEGDGSDISEEVKEKTRDVIVTVPPPSPASSIDRNAKPREGLSPKVIRSSATAHFVYSPPVQRKPMQIPRAVLDLETFDEYSSADEGLSKQSSFRKKGAVEQRVCSAYILKEEKIDMPPELIVTPAQVGEGSGTYERLREIFTGKLQEPFVQKGSLSPDSLKGRRSPHGTLKGAGYLSDSENLVFQSQISLKQTVWTVVPSDDFPISYGLTDTQDDLLRSCSQKLYELKRIQRDKSRRKNKSDEIEVEETQVVESQVLSRAKKKLKRKSLRVKKTEQVSVLDEKSEVLKIRSLYKAETTKNQVETSWTSSRKVTKSSGATRKFRKGGIVATATVQTKTINDYASADESIEKPENNSAKKKKKKRKLQSIQKQVKSVIRVVTSSKTSRKDTIKEKH